MMGGGVDPDRAWAASVFAVERACGAAVPAPTVRRRIAGRHFTRDQAALRRMAVYTAVCGLGVPARRLTRAACLGASTICVFVREMEERRDDPRIDALLEIMRDMALDWLAGAPAGAAA